MKTYAKRGVPSVLGSKVALMDFVTFHEVTLDPIAVKVFSLANYLSLQSNHTRSNDSQNKKFFFSIDAETCSNIL